jgi:hypothetical protein
LAGEFCAACGQQAIDLNASTLQVMQEAFHDAVDLDGRAFRTARALFAPGKLTTEFLRGRRVPYLSPLKLFLLAGTTLTTTWIATRGIDARYYGMRTDQSASLYISTVVRGFIVSAVTIGIVSWAFGLGRRRLVAEMAFAAHLVAAMALWAAVVTWLGSGWKLLWGTAVAVPSGVPALPFILFVPATVAGSAYIVASIHRVYRLRWWWTLLRAVVIGTLGVGAVFVTLFLR